jgi:hypothetical protein
LNFDIAIEMFKNVWPGFKNLRTSGFPDEILNERYMGYLEKNEPKAIVFWGFSEQVKLILII